jgi:hypothetical protein
MTALPVTPSGRPLAVAVVSAAELAARAADYAAAAKAPNTRRGYASDWGVSKHGARHMTPHRSRPPRRPSLPT